MIVDATRLSDDEASDVTLEEDDISDTEVGIRDDSGHNVASTSQRHSKFAIHIAHKLSKPDVENLLKRK